MNIRDRLRQLKWWHWALGAGAFGLVALASSPARAAGRRRRAFETPGGGRIQDNSVLPTNEFVRAQAPDVRGTGKLMHRDVAAAYLEMVAAARAAGVRVPSLAVNSAYRSDAEQRGIWEQKVAAVRAEHPEYSDDQVRAEARIWVAPPGYSNHRSGRTLDLDIEGLEYTKAQIPAMRATATHRWLVANAANYGFYPYEREPWHWEYNPMAGLGGGQRRRRYTFSLAGFTRDVCRRQPVYTT